MSDKAKYDCKVTTEPLILEPEDWSEDEWATILKLFGMEKADRIVLNGYTLETFGVKAVPVTDEEWQKAIKYLEMLIVEYASIGFAGQFGLSGVLVPLRKRYEKGERTRELYERIMECE